MSLISPESRPAELLASSLLGQKHEDDDQYEGDGKQQCGQLGLAALLAAGFHLRSAGVEVHLNSVVLGFSSSGLCSPPCFPAV